MSGLDINVEHAAGRRFLSGRALLYALMLQVGVLSLAVFIVVFRPLCRSEPAFVAKPSLMLPQRELDHRAAVAGFEQAASRPQMERLSVAAMTSHALPEAPDAPAVDFNPFDSGDAMAADAQALLARSGLAGAAGGLKSAASVAAFFGIEDAGERVVVIVDTSASVMRKARSRGVTVERLHAEVLRLIEGLSPGTQFGIVQVSQGVRSFAGHLAPATQGNKAAAAAWIRENLRGNPPVADGAALTGHEAAFAEALRHGPDVVFLVTDGRMNRREGAPGAYSYPVIPCEELLRALRGIRRPSAAPPRIHVVGFEMTGVDAASMRRLAREFHGEIREF